MLNKKDQEKLATDGYDLKFLDRIQPQGGMLVKENHLVCGDGYYACLHIYQLPRNPAPFWLVNLVGNDDCVVKVDFTSLNKESVLKDINKSLGEYSDRMQNERHQTERNNAADEYHLLSDYARQINQGNEVTKLMSIRLFLTAKTKTLLDEQLADLSKTLDGLSYKNVVCIGEQDREWQAFFNSYSEQRALGSREGMPVGSMVIGGGYPFNFQKLIDPFGGFLGVTDTNGAFIFDPFHTTKNRKSFNCLILGKSGYGKSTLQKLIEEILFAKGTIIRGFEKNKDWLKLIKSQNGKVLDLSGRGGILNPLEPLATILVDNEVEADALKIDELASYIQHRDKFFTLIKFLDPEMDNLDALDFPRFLDAFYIHKGLLPKNYMEVYNVNNPNDILGHLKIIGKASKKYPTVKEFYHFLTEHFKHVKFKSLPEDEKLAMRRFLRVIRAMSTTYANVFNGHTTLLNLDSEQVVFFDINTLESFAEPIKCAQLFSAISLVWQQALKNGLKMKTLLAAGEITKEDVTYFSLIIDECQNIINERCEFVLDSLLLFAKEMRKFGGGITFATQLPRTFIPTNENSTYSSKVRELFAICQTKIFFNIDSSDMKLMKEILNDVLTAGEFDALPRLQEREMLINLGGCQTYKVTTIASEEQLKRFDGGH